MPVKIKNNLPLHKANTLWVWIGMVFLLAFSFSSAPANAQTVDCTSTYWKNSYSCLGMEGVTVIRNQIKDDSGNVITDIKCPNPLKTTDCASADGHFYNAPVNQLHPQYGTHVAVVCPNEDPDAPSLQFAMLRRIMPCVKETLLAATNVFVEPLVKFMGGIVSAVGTLAIVLHGIKLVGGTVSATWRDSMVLMAKLGGMVYFSNHIAYSTDNPGGFAIYPLALDVMDDMCSRLIGYALQGSLFNFWGDCMAWTNSTGADFHSSNIIWDYLDCTFEMVIGGILRAANSTTITYGIMGFLMACLVSKGLGVAVGMIGFYLIGQFMTAVVRALYIFIGGYLGVTLCMLIAPMFIPCLLLRSTIGYFKAWLRALIGFMLQPMIVSAYLGMLLTAFNVVILDGPYSLTAALVGKKVVEAKNYGVSGSDDFMAAGGLGGWMLAQKYTKQIPELQGSCMSQSQLDYCNTMTDPDQQTACLNQQSCVYAEKSVGATGVIMDAGAAAATGTATAPEAQSQNYGIGGKLATTTSINTQNQSFFDAIGVTKGANATPMQFLGMDFPAQPVNWEWLRDYNNIYNHKSYSADDSGTNTYLLDILRSMVLAFLVSYILIRMLDIIPFLGSGLSSSGASADFSSIKSKALGIGKLAPASSGGG